MIVERPFLAHLRGGIVGITPHEPVLEHKAGHADGRQSGGDIKAFAINQNAMEGAAGLGCVHIKASPVGHFHPGHHAHNVIKVHIAACAQAMHNLLHPGGATFGVGRNKEVAGLGPVGQTVCHTFRQLGTNALRPFLPFLPRSGPGKGLDGVHVIDLPIRQ